MVEVVAAVVIGLRHVITMAAVVVMTVVKVEVMAAAQAEGNYR